MYFILSTFLAIFLCYYIFITRNNPINKENFIVYGTVIMFELLFMFLDAHNIY
jgi:hypothetical protein